MLKAFDQGVKNTGGTVLKTDHRIATEEQADLVRFEMAIIDSCHPGHDKKSARCAFDGRIVFNFWALVPHHDIFDGQGMEVILLSEGL